MHDQQRRNAISARFREVFHHEPLLWSRAPGRVDLMGSHTDYNQCHVMTMTINLDTWIAACPRPDRAIHAYSMNLETEGSFHLDELHYDESVPWINYLRGVVGELQTEGYNLVGVDMLVHSTIPISSGLSSSAAIEMASAVMFQLAGNFQLEPLRMALLGQRAENRFVGVNCGILDQYSSALGQAGNALMLDCRSLTHSSIPVSAGMQVVICDTRVRRELVSSEYGIRRAQCEEGVRIFQKIDPSISALRDLSIGRFWQNQHLLPEPVARRCQFILEENQRVIDLGAALPAGDRDRLAELFRTSYAGARELYEIVIPAMDVMLAVMLAAPGVVGARQAGAGFGGCMVALVETGQVDEFCSYVARAYQTQTGIFPSIYPVSPSAGAALIE